jgi:hypothetical protein
VAVLADQSCGRKHVRLRLSETTVEQLKDWQHEAYKALRREPTYNELVEAAISRCADLSVSDLVAAAAGYDVDGLDEELP